MGSEEEEEDEAGSEEAGSEGAGSEEAVGGVEEAGSEGAVGGAEEAGSEGAGSEEVGSEEAVEGADSEEVVEEKGSGERDGPLGGRLEQKRCVTTRPVVVRPPGSRTTATALLGLLLEWRGRRARRASPRGTESDASATEAATWKPTHGDTHSLLLQQRLLLERTNAARHSL